MKRLAAIVALLLMPIAAIALVVGAGNAADRLNQAAASDPLNTTYLIEGQDFGLTDGRCELPAAPGSAMKTVTTILGQLVCEDLDRDGDEDAVLLLAHDPGGSGTFYYLAAAVSVEGRYQGTNAVLLGDRIVPRDIGVSNGVVVVRYTDRRPDQPMSVYPSIDKTMALAMENGQLIEIGPLVEGWVTIGHEVRSFQPCNKSEPLWLMGPSPALREIRAAYRRVPPDEKAYRPVLAVLAGNSRAPPADGFGAQYNAAFRATHFVRVAPGENCPPEAFSINSPPPVEKKIRFDVSKLDEDGLYGPPGAKRALAYAFCIPDTVQGKNEVQRIDPTVEFFAQSPGRIGCGTHESLGIGSTHQKDFAGILRRLAELTYVQRIDQSFFE